MTTEFEERAYAIRERIEEAASRAGRKTHEVELIGVTKTFGPDAVRDAWNAKIAIMGENRVQEAAAKIPQCISGPKWHLIGHLQNNKIRAALELFSVIHSVDSEKTLERIVRVAEETGARPGLLLEVNVSGESSKFGFRPDVVPKAIETALAARCVTLEGFMTMAPVAPDPEMARPFFAKLRELRDRWESDFGAIFPQLSMGMSSDFEVAVEEGATWVRIGTALFGNRPKWKPQLTMEDCQERDFILE